MKKNVSEIVKELEKRGLNNPSRTEISSWAIIFLLEELVNK